MKILLINPSGSPVEDYGALSKASTELPQLGLASVANSLTNNGHDVRIIDYHMERLDTDHLLKIIKECKYDLVGFSVYITSVKKTYELSQPNEVPKKPPYQIPYRHLVTLVQIGKNWDEIKKILLRTDQIPRDLNKVDEKHLKQRAEHVKYWLESFAPDMIRFEVKKKTPKLQLSGEQEQFLSILTKMSSSLEWTGENIHNVIYEISEKENIPIKTAFKTIYQVFLGQDKGPRAGYFLSNLDKDFVLKRFKEAVK